MAEHRSNGMEKTIGAAVKSGTIALDRGVKSHGHFWASVNYIHHNPVRHGYTQKWSDWPWSSAARYIERVGPETAAKIWREYPILDYGKKWDFD